LRIFTETEVRHISTSGLVDLLTRHDPTVSHSLGASAQANAVSAFRITASMTYDAPW